VILAPLPISQLPPPSPKGKGHGPEDDLWREVMLGVHGKKVFGVPRWPQFVGFTKLGGMGSDNWGIEAAAAWYAHRPEKLIDGLDAGAWWRRLTSYYLGEVAGPGDLVYFQASEPVSSTYDGFWLGGVLAMLYLARRRGDGETEAAIGRLLAMWARVCALISGPAASEIEIIGLKGREVLKNSGHDIPSTLGIGGRSNPFHAKQDPRSLVLAEILGLPCSHPWPARDPWSNWYLQIASMLKGDFGLSVDEVADLRAVVGARPMGVGVAARDRLAAGLGSTKWKEFDVALFADALVGWMPQCPNGNSAYTPGSVLRLDGSRITHLYPWPGAKSSGLSSGFASLAGGELLVSSGYSTLPPQVISSPILRHWSFGPEGAFRVLGQAGGGDEGSPVDPGPEPEPPTGDRQEDQDRAAGLLLGLQVSKRDGGPRARLVGELTSGAVSTERMAQLVADARRLGVGPKQAQAEQWREAIAIMEGLAK